MFERLVSFLSGSRKNGGSITCVDCGQGILGTNSSVTTHTPIQTKFLGFPLAFLRECQFEHSFWLGPYRFTVSK